jgi:hypothetical protein
MRKLQFLPSEAGLWRYAQPDKKLRSKPLKVRAIPSCANLLGSSGVISAMSTAAI